MRGRRRPKTEPPDISSVSRVLIIRIKSIGDLVLTTPLLSSIRKWRRDIFISFVVDKPFASLFTADPGIDSIISIIPGSLGMFSPIRKLRNSRFDLVINLHGGNRSALFTLASRAKLKLGFEHFHYQFAYTHLIPHPQKIYKRNRTLHTVENTLSPLLWLGIPVENPPRLRLFLPPTSGKRIKKRLEELRVENGFVLIHPFATFKSKEWPGERFAKLGAMIRKELSLPVIFVSDTTREREFREKIFPIYPEARYLVTRQLDELAWLIKHCSLFIGNDAGPTHIAAALKKKIVVIFGSSDDRVWHPWGTSYSLVRHHLPCVPCPGKRCSQKPPFPCINSIELDEVLSAVLSQLDRKGW
jgi:ADP-heptose:LPS heptosyltransferase